MKNVILVFVLWLAGLTAAAQFAKIAVPFAHFQALYPQFDAELGWLLSLVSLVGAVFGIVGGDLVGRFGAKRVLLFGLVLGAAMSFWQANLPGFAMMLFSRVLEGLAHLTIIVAAPTLVGQLSPSRYRGVVMTLWGSFFGVSFVLMAWLGPPVITLGGLPLLLALHGSVMTAIALILAFGLQSDPAEQSDGPISGLSRIVASHVEAYRSPFISAPGIGWLFFTLTFVSLMTILPQLVPVESSALLSGLMPVVSIASSVLVVPLLLHVMTGVSIAIWGLVGGMVVILVSLLGFNLAVMSVILFAVLGLTQGATFAAISGATVKCGVQAFFMRRPDPGLMA